MTTDNLEPEIYGYNIKDSFLVLKNAWLKPMWTLFHVKNTESLSFMFIRVYVIYSHHFGGHYCLGACG